MAASPHAVAPGLLRRSDYDVTDTVRVSDPAAVRDAVEALFTATWPAASFDTLWLAFHDFRRLFRGQLEGYVGCDTLYHDTQHSLDVTLAMARLLAGYEQSCDAADRLGHERAVMGVICALFHDAGYIRRTGEAAGNGAEFTGRHVSRSAGFLAWLLPRLGLAELAPIACQVVHFTGYEIPLDRIELDDPKDSLVGYLLGTADLMAQMADRCYLEKCRDRLYGEFVLAGVAIAVGDQGQHTVKYASGTDLLRQTLDFWELAARHRLEKSFNEAYRYVEPLYGGRNPYMESIARNLAHLRAVLASGDWSRLRRQPPVFTVLPRPVESVGALVSRRLAGLTV
jgi:hypothetical protein